MGRQALHDPRGVRGGSERVVWVLVLEESAGLVGEVGDESIDAETDEVLEQVLGATYELLQSTQLWRTSQKTPGSSRKDNLYSLRRPRLNLHAELVRSSHHRLVGERDPAGESGVGGQRSIRSSDGGEELGTDAVGGSGDTLADGGTREGVDVDTGEPVSWTGAVGGEVAGGGVGGVAVDWGQSGNSLA